MEHSYFLGQLLYLKAEIWLHHCILTSNGEGKESKVEEVKFMSLKVLTTLINKKLGKKRC